MKKLTTKKLVINAMLAALVAVLGYVAIDLINIKFTLETLPISVGAALFGPADGFIVGAVGTFVYQMLRYGFTVTTVLWILTYCVGGMIFGLYAKASKAKRRRVSLIVLFVVAELVITILNTGVMYIDSKIFGYYSFVYIFGTFIVRIILSVAKGVIFSFIVPAVISPARRVLQPERVANN